MRPGVGTLSQRYERYKVGTRRHTDDTPVGLMVSSEALQMSIISPSASGSSPASPNRCREALRDNEPTQSEDRYAPPMESINESVYDWDVESGAVYISPPA